MIPLQIYLKDIGDTPTLSAQEERDLASRIEGFDPEARGEMVKANLKLVVNIAKKYQGRGVALEDLIEEGNLGLMRAVDGYNLRMEYRFSTYAVYWIKHTIRRHIANHGRTLKIPLYMIILLGKWKRAAAILKERTGRDATPDEIAASLKLTKKKFAIVQDAIIVNGMSSLSGGDADNAGWEEEVPDERNKSIAEAFEESDTLSLIGRHIDALDERQATIIRMRFGLDTHEPMSLREVGEKLKLTRERVRQLESLALAKLTESVNDRGARR